METAVETASRLLGALDELIQQEGTFLHGGQYDQVLQTRERSAPLVAELVRLAYEPGVANFRPRVAAVVGRSASHAAMLEEKLAQAGAEIKRLTLARHRAGQVAPAYARSPAGTFPRFQAAG